MATRIMTLWLLTMALMAGCAPSDVHPKEMEVERPPAITKTMPISEAINASIKFGGETLKDTRLLITQRKQWRKAHAAIEKALGDGYMTLENAQLANLAHLYQMSPYPASPTLFNKLVQSGHPLAKQLGWQIASNMPSKKIAQAVEGELTRALKESDEENLYLPQVANAIQSNRLKSSYSVLYQGLLATGHETYATAMANLNPRRATPDFLPYLARADAEELRQLTLSSINVFSATVMLKHMAKYPPSMQTAHVDHLFLYAISRNPSLSELAHNVLERLYPQNKEFLALELARHPAWVQIAFVESARRRINANLSLFLGELKNATAQRDVVDELNEMKL